MAKTRRTIVERARVAEDQARVALTKARLRALSGCERCRSHDDVLVGPDPYAQDVHKDATPRALCWECRAESADSV